MEFSRKGSRRGRTPSMMVCVAVAENIEFVRDERFDVTVGSIVAVLPSSIDSPSAIIGKLEIGMASFDWCINAQYWNRCTYGAKASRMPFSTFFDCCLESGLSKTIWTRLGCFWQSVSIDISSRCRTSLGTCGPSVEYLVLLWLFR